MNNHFKLGSLLLCMLVSMYIPCPSAMAQTYELKISKVTDEKGDDPGATFAIVKDSAGFIWFGTVDGLYRYDGYNYKIFRNEKNKPNSLGWNTIRALCLSNNKLWIGTQGAGLDCFDLLTETFHHYVATGKKKGEISGNVVWSLTSDHQGNIWTGILGNGVDRLNIKTNTFEHFSVLPPSTHVHENITIRSLYEDSEGILWAGLITYGLSAIDPKTGAVRNYRNNPNDLKSIGSNDIYHIFEDSKKRLIVCAYTNGMNIFDRNTGSFSRYATAGRNTNRIMSDLPMAGIERKPGEYWIGTEYGLSVIDLNHTQITQYQHEKNIHNSLSDNRIRAIYNDTRGIVWIASEAGVDKVIEKQNFKIYKNKPGDPNSFPEGIIRSILEDGEQNMWFGIIDNGVVKYNPTTKRFQKFTHNASDPKSISGSHITSIFLDSEHHLWLGEWDTGLNSYDPANNSFKLAASTTKTKAKLCDTRIQFIKEATPGILWIGTETGINRYNTRTQACTYMLHDEKNPNSLSGNSVQSNAFIQDDAGNLWIGTWSEGLNRVTFSDSLQEQATFKNWKFDPANPEGLNNNNVISLCLNDSLLWIGTFGGGLNCMNIHSGKFQHYTTENGLPNNIIFAILKDNDNNLWLSTDKGLSKFNSATGLFQNYSKSDGLQDDHFFWGSAFKSNSGELFFGGINGVNSFSPQNIMKDSQYPVPILTDLKIFETSVASDMPIGSITSLKVPYDKNYLTFEYIALDYAEQNKNTYMVKMEGLETNWHNIGNRRITTYSSLAPGSYTFRLKVANKDGLWCKKELGIQLTISPPWWNTWLARSAMVIIIASGLLAFYFIRIGLLKTQTHKLEDLVTIRTREINQQKEELLTVNENLTEQKEELSEALNKLRRTQKQLIESEKMASLGVLTAGVAHEINNPLNFIQAGIYGIENCLNDSAEDNDTTTKQNDITNLLNRMKTGVTRVSGIVNSLNHFSRQPESTSKLSDIHTIIDNCLLILNHQLVPNIEVSKRYTTHTYLINANEGKLHLYF